MGDKPGIIKRLPVLAVLLLLIALHCRSPNWYPKYEFHLPLSFPEHFGICNPPFMLLLLWRKAKQAGDPDYVLEKQLTDVGNAAKTWKVKRKDESVKKNLFSVSYIVCIINRWKIISDKAVKFVNPSENTDFFKLRCEYYGQPHFTARCIHLS